MTEYLLSGIAFTFYVSQSLSASYRSIICSLQRR